ncbi:family 43 glycosylhydrolase [Nonomuraea sp. NPDC048892]|uniref:family 43 glycosylhydrolase n=1 Tax=Nonomuraea sp. NPDC048892 TaxID=3154624 RepID=UPI0033FC182D
MNVRLRHSIAVVLLLAGAFVNHAAAPVTIANGTQFRDTSGKVLHAHGGGILREGGYYYWFGETRNPDNTFRAVSVYRSTDLKNWEFRNDVLTRSSHPELDVANIERPKVIYNNSTGRFVMWMHKENGSNYSEARAAVASSATVDGDYTYHGSFRPLGQHMSRDITLFNDNGTAYMISAADENYDLHIYRLTSDYLNVSTLVGNFWNDAHREAPAMFKRGNVYFLLTSAATGWNPNQARYATASSISGPWTGWTNVGDGTTFGSQPAYVTIDTATGVVSGGGTSLYYRITARGSGKVMDVVGASTADGANVIQYTCGGGANQQWSRTQV